MKPPEWPPAVLLRAKMTERVRRTDPPRWTISWLCHFYSDGACFASGGKKGRMFFFEKKNQKTFIYLR
jgi:hypothetical protein